MTEAPSSPETNLLLASLPAQKLRRLLRRCEVVTLRANEDLYEVGESIEFVHFPKKGCVISLVKVLDDDEHSMPGRSAMRASPDWRHFQQSRRHSGQRCDSLEKHSG